MGSRQGRLIPFSYNTEQSYHLLFTDLMMRVIKDGQFVLRPLSDTDDYKWTRSTVNPLAWYLTTDADADPALVEPGVHEFYYVGYGAEKVTTGLDSESYYGKWYWGNLDTLGFNTVYFVPGEWDAPDPDGEQISSPILGAGGVSNIAATTGNALTISDDGSGASYADTAGLTLALSANSEEAYVDATYNQKVSISFTDPEYIFNVYLATFQSSDEDKVIVVINTAGDITSSFIIDEVSSGGRATAHKLSGTAPSGAYINAGEWGFSTDDIIAPGTTRLTSSGSFFGSGDVGKFINIINTSGTTLATYEIKEYDSVTAVTANLTNGSAPSSPVAAAMWDFSTETFISSGDFTLTCGTAYFTVGTPDIGEHVIIISTSGITIGTFLITATASTTEVTATYVSGQTPTSAAATLWGLSTETIIIGDSDYAYCCVARTATAYAFEDLALLKYAQTADVMYIDHTGYAPARLSRTDDFEWAFTDEVFTALPSAVTNFAGDYAAEADRPRDIKYKIAAVMEDTEEETLPSASITVAVDRPWDAGITVDLTWTAVTGATSYKIYKSSRGFYGWIGTIHSDTGETKYSDDNVDPDVADSHRRPNNPFEDSNHPGCVAIHQQRMIHAGLVNDKTQFNGSVTGIWDNFTESRPLQANDSYEGILASMQVDEIRHMIPLNGLAILTSGSEWVLRPGVNDNAVAPTSMRLDVQSYRGCSHVPPLVVGSTVLFNSRDGQTVYDFGYFYASDRYETQNMTVLAQHLFEDRTIKEWAYQQKPNSVVWCVMSDGTLLSFTYIKEQEVWAWAQHSTSGTFESISAIPGQGTYDEVAVIIKREVNGETVYYVESMAERLPDDDDTLGVFLDSALEVTLEADATILTGMDHLEGKEVWVLAGGVVIKDLIVLNGEVTLGTTVTSGSHVICGLPIPTPTLEMLPLENQDAYGKKRTIGKVLVRLENTRGLWCGQDEDNMYEAKWRTAGTLTADPDTLVSGDTEVVVGTKWGFQTGLVIQQKDPLPQTISAVIPEVTFGG